MPGLRIHDLRHAHATLMLGSGVHPKVVSERLGHASVNITLDTYCARPARSCKPRPRSVRSTPLLGRGGQSLRRNVSNP